MPKNRVQLIKKCQKYLERIDEQSDADLKLAVVQKLLPDFKPPSTQDLYVDGLFDAAVALNDQRNDSLAKVQLAMIPPTPKIKSTLWTQPLSGHL